MTEPEREKGPYADWTGQAVVVDTDSAFVYIGRLLEVSQHFVALADVDAHDMGDSPKGQTKERYVRETREFGVRENRREARVLRARVVSLTRLADVTEV